MSNRTPDNFYMGHDGMVNFYRAKREPDAHGILRRVNTGDRAQVYGQIDRYSKMRDRECRAAIEKMAYEIDMARSQFKWHLDALVRDQFVICLQQSKGGRGRPSRYVPTGKLAALNDVLNRETPRVEEGLESDDLPERDVTPVETLRVPEGIEPETLRVQEGSARNPPRTHDNPPRTGGEETIRDHATQKTKKEGGDQGSAPLFHESQTVIRDRLAEPVRAISADDLRARIAEEKRAGMSRPRPTDQEVAQ